MAKLPDKFSVAKAVEFISSGGHKVRPVDVNGFALDDGTQQYSVAHPVVEVDSTGTVTTDSTQIKSTHKKVTSDPKGTPVIIVGGDGTSLGTVPGGGGGITYDTAIGNGVDANGFASLPLNTGAKRFYVNSSTGSDTNTSTTAQNPSTPVATISKALSFLTAGNGDQVLIAEGTGGYTWPNYSMKQGASPQYPTVVQSYDPADPTNEAKLGRAAGANRPIITNSFTMLGGSGVSQKYIAVRGLEFNPGNVADAGVVNVPNTTGTPDYLLFENNIFAYTALSFDVLANGVRTQHIIVRNSALYGQWSSSSHAQGLYVAGVDGLTVEDCVFWHNGWKIGANWTDPASSGGATVFNHPIYAQDTTRNVVVRRNAIIYTSADGGVLKGGALYQNNLILNNKIGAGLGGGNNYDVDAPLGVQIDASYNVVLNSISGATPWGFGLVNGASGLSKVRYNILAHPASTGYAFLLDATTPIHTNSTAAMAKPSYADFDNNITDLWSSSGSTKLVASAGNTDPSNTGIVHATFDNNLWDDPTSGTNTNNGSTTFANAYTEATLLAALPGAYPDETTAVNDWIAHPEQRGWRNGVALAQAGYGLAIPAPSDLITNMSLTVGVPSSGRFIGTQDGYALSVVSGALPTGVTIDSDCRCWRYDGTGAAGTGTVGIKADNGTLNHTTTVSWTVYNAPVLSSLSVTPGSTTATINLSTNTGSGTLYSIVSTSSTVPDWPYVVIGLNEDFSLPTAVPAPQAVTATGAQSIPVTGLTASTTYNAYVFQMDPNKNPSLVGSAAFTTASSWTPASLGSNLVLDLTNLSMSNLYTDTAHTTNVTADGQTVKAIKDPTTGIIFTNSTGWVYHANSGKPYLAIDGTSQFTSTTAITFADATGQYAMWETANLSGTPGANGNLVYAWVSPGGALLNPNTSLNTNSFNIRSSSAQLANASSKPVSANTDAVFSGISTGTSGTGGNIEAFVNNVDTPGSGVVAWSGTPLTSGTLALSVSSASAGKFYGLLIAKGDQTSNRASAQTYMAALHP